MIKTSDIFEPKEPCNKRGPVRVVAIDIYNRILVEPLNKPLDGISFWDRPAFEEVFKQLPHTHINKITGIKFTPTAKNKFGDVRHTGHFQNDGWWGKRGDRFETWLTPDNFEVI